MIKNFSRHFLFALTLAFLTACGGDKSVDAALTEKEIAIEKIKLYADDQSKPEPSVQDYIDAGLTGIDEGNLSDINNLVGTLTPEDVDTTEELIELTDQLGINNQPIVNAGENKTLEAGQSVTITGTATDIDGTIASYQWEESGNALSTSASFSYSSAVVGPHALVFTATDNDGDSSTASMEVNVTDTTKPNITLLGDNPVSINEGEIYVDAGSTAQDIVDGAVSPIISGTVDYSTPGTYTLTYTATDEAGNTETATRVVTVIALPPADTTAPVITLLGENPQTVMQDDGYIEAGATATDNVDGSVAVTITGSVDTATPGEYTVTYTAEDAAENSASVTRTVIVKAPDTPDTTAPTVTLKGDNPMIISVGDMFTDPGVTATDDMDTDVAVTSSGTVDENTLGTYTLTYTATDDAGNSSSEVSRKVIVAIADTEDYTTTDISRQTYYSFTDQFAMFFKADNSGADIGSDNDDLYKRGINWSINENNDLIVDYGNDGQVRTNLRNVSDNVYTMTVYEGQNAFIAELYQAKSLSVAALNGKIFAFDTTNDTNCTARTIKITGNSAEMKEQCSGGFFQETLTLTDTPDLDNTIDVSADNGEGGVFNTRIQLIKGELNDGTYLFIDEPENAQPADMFLVDLTETDAELTIPDNDYIVVQGDFTDSAMANGALIKGARLKTRGEVTVDIAIKTPDTAPVADLILFSGGGGIVDMPVNEQEGSVFITSGNFLVRSRDLFVANNMRVIIVDAPSDIRELPNGMNGTGFRNSDQHRQDIDTVISYIKDENGLNSDLPLWLVGTSRGTESAAYLSLNLQSAIDGLVLTSPLTVSNFNGTSILDLNLPGINVPVLQSAHELDGCSVTPPDNVGLVDQALTTAIKKVDIYTGGNTVNADPCKANTYHGFLGIEDAVVGDIADFIKSPASPFKFSTEYLNGKTLYDVYEECTGDWQNGVCTGSLYWEMGVITFSSTTYSAYQVLADGSTGDSVNDVPYQITAEGYISFFQEDEGEVQYIKPIELTDGFIRLDWTSTKEGIDIDRYNDYFFFTEASAQAFLDAKNQ